MKSSLFLALILTLPSALAAWSPVGGKIMTEWGRQLDPAKVWQEYPRPLLERKDWTNLNGIWSYAIVPASGGAPEVWSGGILVPFVPESALSGVGKLIQPDQALWYKRSFQAKQSAGKRTLLHFEAVDYETTVWVNGKEVGKHTGGFTPFSCDITSVLQTGENELRVRVTDATSGYQLVGKQHLNPHGIWYTRVTGIWQTAWMEEVNTRAIEDLIFTSDIKAGTITIRAKLAGPAAKDETLRVSATHQNRAAGAALGHEAVVLKLENPKLWSPDEPNLYDLTVDLLDGSGNVIDSVRSYTALREIGKTRDKNGNLRFTLNGKPIFHWGPLDQGWWPDGLLTPPSDEAMLFDIRFLKSAGFNMIRKHIKIEPRRYYRHCDEIGMMVWQDQVSMGYGPQSQPKGSNPTWSFIAPNPKDGVWPDSAHEQFVVEYKRMVDLLRNHPSIVVWSPFNEAWGQHRTMETGKMAVAYDNTRHINIASGGNFWPIGDIADNHAYPEPNFPTDDNRFKNFIKVIGEFGGHGWPVKGHLWDSHKENWGYGSLPQTMDEWKQRYISSINLLSGLRRQGVAAGVYTQTTDVEGEINGLLTYDRIPKVDAEWLRAIHEKLLNTPDAVSYQVILPTSEKKAQEWQYTTGNPGDGWQMTDFDASEWKSGKGGFGTQETPNTMVRTPWDSGAIWLRREFEFPSAAKGSMVLRVFHDEDATIYLNGIRIAELPGHVSNYVTIDTDDQDGTTLKSGRNVLAVHCQQTTGGQFIDVGLLDETISR